jgi:hypothetical protein
MFVLDKQAVVFLACLQDLELPPCFTQPAPGPRGFDVPLERRLEVDSSIMAFVDKELWPAYFGGRCSNPV